MTLRIKSSLRDALPDSVQVPLKYYFNRLLRKLEPEMELLPYLIVPGDRVVDVGGNRGIYAFRLAQLGARVEVFEPNPGCYRILQAWAAAQPSVTVHPVGLSDRAGSVVLHIPIDMSGVEHDASASIEPHAFRKTREQTVQLLSLDGLGLEAVSLIKIDVEGHEYSVLRGAVATIEKWQPAVLVEVEQRHLRRPILDVFTILTESGYCGWFLDGGRLLPIARFNAQHDQAVAAFGVTGQRYINNFLFLSRQRLSTRQYSPLLDCFGAA